MVRIVRAVYKSPIRAIWGRKTQEKSFSERVRSLAFFLTVTIVHFLLKTEIRNFTSKKSIHFERGLVYMALFVTKRTGKSSYAWLGMN
jgi:hypothetical protein